MLRNEIAMKARVEMTPHSVMQFIYHYRKLHNDASNWIRKEYTVDSLQPPEAEAAATQ